MGGTRRSVDDNFRSSKKRLFVKVAKPILQSRIKGCRSSHFSSPKVASFGRKNHTAIRALSPPPPPQSLPAFNFPFQSLYALAFPT